MMCGICNKRFSCNSALSRHKLNVHNVSKSYICAYCSEHFVCKLKLRDHIKDHHLPSTGKIICGMKCREKFVNYDSYKQHLTMHHKLLIVTEKITFCNLNDFYTWKLDIERKQKCTYVRYGKKIGKIYFSCNRSYSKKPLKNNDRKRNIKSGGSLKTEYTCPSTIKLYRNATEIVVEYCNYHLHNCDVGHQRISKVDRRDIADKLAMGLPVEKILREVRENVVFITDRIHLLEKKDIHNIKRDFNINKSFQYHENDAASVSLWVQDVRTDSESNPVLFFKQQEEEPVEEYKIILNKQDFVLIIMSQFQKEIAKQFIYNIICIDATHGLNNYNFLLHNILTVDEYGNGVPIAHCFSNKKDSSLYKIFFNEIKKLLGPIKPKVLMTDDDVSIVIGWNSIMNEPEKHLLCTWHIFRSWNQNLNKIKNDEKKKLVYKSLKSLITVLDKSEFLQQLDQIVHDLFNDPETVDFGTYFNTYYVPRTEKWAHAFRKYCGINTNMYLENFHKQIKHCYLNGKKCRRMDEAIGCMMQIIHDKLFERAIKILKNKRSRKVQDIDKSHTKSEEFNNECIETLEENTKYYINSNNKKYLVERIIKKEQCNCKLRCVKCNICIHDYKCSCINNVIHYNICKHIHSVHSLKFSDNNSASMESTVPQQPCMSVIRTTATPSHSSIIQKLKFLTEWHNNNQNTPDSIAQVNQYLDKAITFVKNCNGRSSYLSSQETKAIKGEKQLRYYSTVKKKKPAEKELNTNNDEVFLDHDYCKQQ